MMHYFIFPNKDTYITENSPDHIVNHANSTTKNYGHDEILQLKKEFVNSYSTSSYNVSRILLQFDMSDIKTELNNGNITDPKYYLRLYEVEGQKELDKSYSLEAFPLSQSWDEGVGSHYSNPDIKDGTNWVSGSIPWYVSGSHTMTFEEYFSEFDLANEKFGAASSSIGLIDSGSRTNAAGGGVWFTQAGKASQSFSNESPDIEMDVTDIVSKHVVDSGGISNMGILLKFSGSYESDLSKQNLKFFSRNTHTIYPPKLEVRWKDERYTNSITGLTSLTMSGEVENHIFVKGLQSKYRSDEKVRFYLGCRKKYVQKTFTESMLTSSFLIPQSSGSYSIVDVATNTAVIPFSDYTNISANNSYHYFDQWFNTFEPGRYYKILFKLKYDDGQESIIDNNEEFKII